MPDQVAQRDIWEGVARVLRDVVNDERETGEASHLTAADIEAVAVRVAEIVRELVPVGSARYVDAAELALCSASSESGSTRMPQTSR
jgi:hypothetical protein